MVCKIAPSGTPTHRGVTAEQSSEIAEFETALDQAGYGKFSHLVLGASSLAFFTTGVQNCVMSYVMPAARCELNLSTYQVGLVNMAFMCGGVASAFFWGIAGDVFGRRNILSLTLLLDALILLAQSTFTDFRLLLAARTINGFLIGGPSTLVFTYLSDLVGEKKRQLYLNITGMCFVAAWLILPAIAWIVIPFKGHETVLPLFSWRLYLALGSIPGFLAGALVLLLPESPRLLADTNRSNEALKILVKVHKWNGGKEQDFKIKKLIADPLVVKSMGEEGGRTKELFISVLRDLKLFVSKTYAVKSSLIMFVFFANMAAGFGLNLWIPELLLRMQTKECKNSALEPQSMFLANNGSSWRVPTSTFSYDTNETLSYDGYGVRRSGDEKCTGHMDDSIFTSGLVAGACCLLGTVICSAVMSRGGAKGARGVRAAAGACALSGALAAAVLAACVCACTSSSKVAVAAAALLNSASLNGNVLLIRLLLHALPAKLSGMGVCWGAWWGRAGGVASNFAVGALLDYSCPAPFISVAALLAVSIGGIIMIKLETEKTETAEASIEEEGTQNRNKGVCLDRYISTHM